MATGPKRFRILSLDGGGIKGAFTAAVLAEWEKRTGRVIVDHFDLIAGTSTGGIIALGLGLCLPLDAIDLLSVGTLSEPANPRLDNWIHAHRSVTSQKNGKKHHKENHRNADRLVKPD